MTQKRPPPPAQIFTRPSRKKHAHASTHAHGHAGVGGGGGLTNPNALATTTTNTKKNIESHPFNVDGYRYTPWALVKQPLITQRKQGRAKRKAETVEEETKKEEDETEVAGYEDLDAPHCISLNDRHHFAHRIFANKGEKCAKPEEQSTEDIMEGEVQNQRAPGHRMARASFGIKHGRGYFEIKVIDNQGIRVGWARRGATLLGPVGYDAFSYAAVIQSKPTSPNNSIYYTHKSNIVQSPDAPNLPVIKPGDVIGCWIDLPPDGYSGHVSSPELIAPAMLGFRGTCKRKRTVISIRSKLWLEYQDVTNPDHKEWLETDAERMGRGSFGITLNGIPLETAFTNLPAPQDFPLEFGPEEDRYYPAISLFRQSHVDMNLGPALSFPMEDFPAIYEQKYARVAQEYLWDIMDQFEPPEKKTET